MPSLTLKLEKLFEGTHLDGLQFFTVGVSMFCIYRK